MKPETLQDLIKIIREKHDILNSSFITDEELTAYISESLNKIDDLINDKLGY